MHVIHIVRDLDLASGGPSRSVPALAQSQAQTGEIKVSLLYRDHGNPLVPLVSGEVRFEALSSHQIWSRGALVGVRQSGKGKNCAEILHLHGLWSPLLHGSARLARHESIPYVISTRGMLANWALGHKSLKKKLAWRLYQHEDLSGANCILASSEFEKRDVSALLPHSKVIEIPNGCQEKPAETEFAKLLPQEQGMHWALAMGRLHPVKGYAELIQAWASLRPSGWKLAIAGPDESGYRSTLEGLIEKHGLSRSVILLGEVDDTQKWSLLSQCELFVAPSKTENFGMAIAEALQSGTPVITTTGTPWRELQEYNCGWWIAPGVEDLVLALGEATSHHVKDLQEKGARGHRLISEKYTWDQVAARTIDVYRSILSERAIN